MNHSRTFPRLYINTFPTGAVGGEGGKGGHGGRGGGNGEGGYQGTLEVNGQELGNGTKRVIKIFKLFNSHRHAL